MEDKIYGKVAIFRNDRKQQGDKGHKNWPDYNGKITITEDMKPGTYDVGIYKNKSKAGNDYLGGIIREEWKPQPKTQPQMSQQDGNAIDNSVEDLDEVPF